ncbi:MAG: ParB/RepB/Spo0J family partition protein [Salinivirgaceae bacterium]|nr:ParB/RepB/Spo0J family partition protein [Salinivirgaceae bacterium]MBO7594324.1 ParB/RepB/Spo0J family partition protein [Salinivirgaceae bacterium]
MATPKKPALGRNMENIMGIKKGEGLGALLKAAPTQGAQNSGVNEIDLSLIEANPFQPRTEFDEDALNELAESIKQLGVIQPVTLRKLDSGRYQIIMGERRCRASKIAGLKTVPAFIRTANDQEMLELALVENIQRKDLNPIDIAISYQRMIEECGFTQEKLADRVGKERSTVTNFLRMLKLPEELQLGLRKGFISMGHAKALLSIDDVNDQTFLFERILNEGLSVRATEDIAREMKEGLDKPKSKKKKTENDSYKELEDKLKGFFKSKVKFSRTDKGNGKIVIPFTNDQDLERLIGLFDKLNSI